MDSYWILLDSHCIPSRVLLLDSVGFLLDPYWIPIEFLLNSDWIPNGPTPAQTHGRWWGGREVPVPFFETTVFSWCSETTTLLFFLSGPLGISWLSETETFMDSFVGTT